MNHVYRESIDFKLKSAAYHYDNLIKVIGNKQDKDREIIAISSEFTAMMLVYQSTLDVLAQLINDSRKLNLNRNRLYFSTIIRKLHSIPDLRDDILKLKQMSIYINDYCNTVKHRNLISVNETQVHQTAMIGLGIHMGIHFYFHVDSFKKDNRNHSEKGLPKYPRELQETLPEIFKNILSQI